MKITTAAKGFYIALVLLLGLAACKKKSDLILSSSQLTIGSYLILDSKGNDTLFLNNQSKAVSISVHYKGEKSTLVTVYVSTNNSIDTTTWRKLGEFPLDASGKATLSTTPAQIAAALGRPIPNGAEYTLYNKVTTQSGRTYSLANTNTDFEASPDYHMALRWTVKAPCSWDQSPFNGQFTVITDTWQDFNPGEKIDVRPGPGPNQIQIKAYPAPAYGYNQQWVTIDVDPVTLATTVSEQLVGFYFPAVNTTMRSPAGGGSVNPCNKKIDINNITFNYGGSQYGLYHLVVQQF